ncbi:hypothetical protein [Chroococcidiopsis sp. SAG 2025]|uniref:hypothetical protein n=1 Tax=Chroococcidiopsis sp. SAG 2025 TaxID=171389 RepID=UPI002936FBD5|nr:hypothetical protein [Chroococcidiopsis sp. SAG 2025]
MAQKTKRKERMFDNLALYYKAIAPLNLPKLISEVSSIAIRFSSDRTASIMVLQLDCGFCCIE